MTPTVLAVIPARSGSKGLPGKNVRLFGGIPLIAHSILLARRCPEVTRTIVSTDSEEIADVAVRFGAEAPFLRPPELARDETPIWPVIRHAVEQVGRYDVVLLLEPTSPARLPTDVSGALVRLTQSPGADGVVGVSRPSFHPVWHAVVENNGYMEHLLPEGRRYGRRQELPVVYRINGSLYAWRKEFVERERESWLHGRHVLYEIPEERALNIDEQREFELAELMLERGLLRLPWLDEKRVARS